MRTIENEAISASAGSGKTFQLAHRYIALMASGVAPARIIAVTFSRKAAGEIFDSIVTHLCRAATNPEQAAAVARLIGQPEAGPSLFLRCLRSFVTQLQRLHIGTLDSFIVGVLRAFPVELGIPPEFRVLDEDGAEAAEITASVLGRLSDPALVSPVAQRQFWEAFRQATFGQEEKVFEKRLLEFVQEYRKFYRMVPDGTVWGEPRLIWPHGTRWLDPGEDPLKAGATLLAQVKRADISPTHLRRWEEFVEAVGKFTYGTPWKTKLTYLFEKLVAVVKELEQGAATLAMDRKKQRLAPEACRAACALLRHVMRIELTAALESTRGIYRVLAEFERYYDAYARQHGQLTFSDAQYLLTAANAFSGGVLLSRQTGRERRLYIDYRLNCQLDHWLLDEFQDTSDLQWQAISNLIDEILQDDSGQRSFFYVGDVKQAVYGWRGGNARLFESILKQYPGRIRTRSLNTSFRSCPAVINTVNRVFSDLTGLDLPEEAVARWSRIWREHACEPGRVPANGYTALLAPAPGPERKRPAEEDHCHLLARVLEELDPVARGLSVAVLVSTNIEGKNVVDALRRECRAIPVVHEGRAQINDNPVVGTLLALAKFSAHPGDTFAWRQVQMSPLRQLLEGEAAARQNLPLSLLREIHAGGFSGFVRAWGERLNAICPLDAFGRARLADLRRAAAEFDETGKRDVNAFLRFVNSYEVRAAPQRGAVRVMTIHQSKGLGFDVVFLPLLADRHLASAGRIKLHVARDSASQQPRWVLRMPRRAVLRADPVLAADAERVDADECFESLCELYVALTRARQGLYIFISGAGATSAAKTASGLLKARLAADVTAAPTISLGGANCLCFFEEGDRAWYRSIPATKPPPPPPLAPVLPRGFTAQPALRKRVMFVEPSARETAVRRAGWLFDPASRKRRELGMAVHALFARLEWADTADPESIAQDWLAHSSDAEDVKREACEQFRHALASAQVQQALARPPADQVELWREKHFEIVLENDEWVSGTFDRVVILRDASGRARRARIVDYKSDQVTAMEAAGVAEIYRGQIQLYVRALARILQLPLSSIEAALIFTSPATVVPVH